MYILAFASHSSIFVYQRLGLYRDAEKQFRSALKQQDMVDSFLYLAKVYVKLDQPITAIEMYKQGLEKFASEPSLLTGFARIYEVSIPLWAQYCNFKVGKFYETYTNDLGVKYVKMDI